VIARHKGNCSAFSILKGCGSKFAAYAGNLEAGKHKGGAVAPNNATNTPLFLGLWMKLIVIGQGCSDLDFG